MSYEERDNQPERDDRHLEGLICPHCKQHNDIEPPPPHVFPDYRPVSTSYVCLYCDATLTALEIEDTYREYRTRI